MGDRVPSRNSQRPGRGLSRAYGLRACREPDRRHRPMVSDGRSSNASILSVAPNRTDVRRSSAMTFLAAAVQMTTSSDKAANLEKAERLIRLAAARGARLVGLPEVFNWRGKRA